jgi:hypothetical protein
MRLQSIQRIKHHIQKQNHAMNHARQAVLPADAATRLHDVRGSIRERHDRVDHHKLLPRTRKHESTSKRLAFFNAWRRTAKKLLFFG